MPSMEFNEESALSFFSCHEKDIHAIAVDEKHICTASKDMTIKVCDADSGNLIHTCEGHTYDVNALLLVGRTLYSGADARGPVREFLKAWDIESGKLLHTFDGLEAGVWAMAVDKKRRHLFSGGDDRLIHVWDMDSHECIRMFKGHSAKVRCLHYCEEDGRLYSGGHDSQVLVWDTNSGECEAFKGQSGYITSILVDDGRVYTGSSEKSVFMWDKVSKEKLAVFNHDNWVASLLMFERTLLVGLGNGTIQAWSVSDPNNTSVLFSLKGHMQHNAVSSMAVHAAVLFSAAWDGGVSKWDIVGLNKQGKEQLLSAETCTNEALIKNKDADPAKADESSMFDDVDCELLE